MPEREQQTLLDRRLAAAASSGYTSSWIIKQHIMIWIHRLGPFTKILDVGAGRGDLLEALRTEHPSLELTGLDIAGRPDSLSETISWISRDLNEEWGISESYDLVICSETIEHLENPRHVFRCLRLVLEQKGCLLLTMPNQESLRSYASLMTKGHYVAFLEGSYPAHITALLREDLRRLCAEVGLEKPTVRYTDHGGIPKLPSVSWQAVSAGMCRGRLFSDNLIMYSFCEPSGGNV